MQRDPYAWFDPFAAREAADQMADELSYVDADRRHERQHLEQRAAYYSGRVQGLETAIDRMVKALPLTWPPRPMMVSGDAATGAITVKEVDLGTC